MYPVCTRTVLALRLSCLQSLVHVLLRSVGAEQCVPGDLRLAGCLLVFLRLAAAQRETTCVQVDPTVVRLIMIGSPNTALQRTSPASPVPPLSFKTFGAAVKIRAGRRFVAARGSAQHRPCVHRLIPASTAGPWAHRTPRHLEGQTARAYRATRGIQLI